MASLKGATKSALEDRSPRFLLGTIALGVVISLIVGFGIGYAAHTSDGSSPKKATKLTTAQKKKAAKARKARKASRRKVVAAPDLTGGIFAVSRGGITVLNSEKKGVKVVVGPKARVALSSPGKATDLVVGSKLLYWPAPKNANKAATLVVLPKTALIGSTVSAVDPGNSVTIKLLSGDKKLDIKGATVYVTTTGTKKKLAKSQVVAVKYYLVGASRKPTATQVVVMPAPPKA